MNHSEIDCIVQARMGSSRLYGKVLAKADDEYIVFDYLINQLKHSKLIQKIIIATTTNKEDDLIVEFAKKNQIEFFRGNESDVLDRYYQCAKNFSSNNILRITSDSPLTDPTVIDDLIINYQKISCDYASTNLIRTYPLGLDAEIFSFNVLEKAWKNATLSSEKEHVTPYIRNKKVGYRLGNLENDEKVGRQRWTLDRIEDFELIKKIIERIDKRPILMKDVLDLLSNEPELIKINAHIPANEGMLKSVKRDEDEKNKII